MTSTEVREVTFYLLSGHGLILYLCPQDISYLAVRQYYQTFGENALQVA